MRDLYMRRSPFTAVLLCAALQAVGQSSVAVPVIQSKATLVNVDVVVTDSKGQPIRGLKQDAFTIREDKTEQSIKSFDEHSGGVPLASAPAPPGVFTNVPPVQRSATENVLVLDWLNTPAELQPFMRDQLVKFVGRPAAGDAHRASSRSALGSGFCRTSQVIRSCLKSPCSSRAANFSPLLRAGGSGVDPSVVDFEKQDSAYGQSQNPARS